MLKGNVPRISYFSIIAICLSFCKNVSSTGTGSAFKDSKPSFNGGKLVKNVEHMKKDLDSVIDIAIENISVEHMQFYFFRLHDFNNDQRLDGNELFVALHESTANEETPETNPADLESAIADAVDALLDEADQNNDGFISWKEYLAKVRSFVDKITE